MIGWSDKRVNVLAYRIVSFYSCTSNRRVNKHTKNPSQAGKSSWIRDGRIVKSDFFFFLLISYLLYLLHLFIVVFFFYFKISVQLFLTNFSQAQSFSSNRTLGLIIGCSMELAVGIRDIGLPLSTEETLSTILIITSTSSQEVQEFTAYHHQFLVECWSQIERVYVCVLVYVALRSVSLYMMHKWVILFVCLFVCFTTRCTLPMLHLLACKW